MMALRTWRVAVDWSSNRKTGERWRRDAGRSSAAFEERVEDEREEVVDGLQAAIDLHADRRALPQHDQHVGEPVGVVMAADLAGRLGLADDAREQGAPLVVGALHGRLHGLAELGGLQRELRDEALAGRAVRHALLAAELEHGAQPLERSALAVADDRAQELDVLGAGLLDQRHAEVLFR